MGGTTVRTPEEFEATLRTYGSERAEEARAVRVGEKERSEAAAIVARYADLFTREQLDHLREREDAEQDDVERERLHRLRKSCEGGLLARELVHLQDEVQNELLAIRVEYRGEEMPLRNAQAKLAVLDAYNEREELGEIHADATATMNERRLGVARAAEKMRAELSGISDPVERSEDDKGISLRQLAEVLPDGSALVEDSFMEMRERWLDRILGADRAASPSAYHAAYETALAAQGHLFEGAGDGGLPGDVDGARLRPRGRQEHPHRPRGPPAEDAAPVRDPGGPADGRSPHNPAARRSPRLPGFLNEAGHALHYAGCDPDFRTRSARSRGTTR